MRHLLIFSVLTASACYQPASVLTSNDILDISVADTTGITANGEDFLDITVLLDEDTESSYTVTVRTSSGTLDFNGSSFSIPLNWVFVFKAALIELISSDEHVEFRWFLKFDFVT